MRCQYSIRGSTLSSFFNLTCKGSGSFPLNNKQKLRLSLDKIKIIIIDGISMVSAEILILVEERLRATLESFAPFGG